MSEIQQQILNTEQALTSILDELKDLQDATSQINQAKEVSQRVLRTSEEVNAKVIELLRASGALIKYLEESEISEGLNKIIHQNVQTQESINSFTETLVKGNEGSYRSFEIVFERVKILADQLTMAQSSLNSQIKALTDQVTEVDSSLERRLKSLTDQITNVDANINTRAKKVDESFSAVEEHIKGISEQNQALEKLENQSTEQLEKALKSLSLSVLASRKISILFGALLMVSMIVNIVLLLIRH